MPRYGRDPNAEHIRTINPISIKLEGAGEILFKKTQQGLYVIANIGGLNLGERFYDPSGMRELLRELSTQIVTSIRFNDREELEFRRTRINYHITLREESVGTLGERLFEQQRMQILLIWLTVALEDIDPELESVQDPVEEKDRFTLIEID